MTAEEKIKWILITKHPFDTYKLKVPGGWLIMIDRGNASSVSFVPDPRHLWNDNIE